MPEAKDPYRYFRPEARDLLASLQAGALELERGSDPRPTAARMLRLAHTLKGAARVVRVTEVAEQAHRIEDLLVPVRESGSAGEELVSALLGALDVIQAQLARLDVPALPQAAQPQPPEPPRSVELDGLHVSLRALDALLDGLLEVRALARAGDPGEVERGLLELQAQLSELRLVPARVMTGNLERVARDTAVAAGKRVEVTATGVEVRLDAPVLAAVQESMVQLVRNAVAHGIEPAAERERDGKPPAGRISIDVRRSGSRVVVRCRDDGRGIDPARIREAALAKGLIGPAEARSLDRERALALLLRGGLSTAERVTQVAGRGVGLEVVREAIERVAGEVSIRTEPGRETEVALSVPVSLAALDALLVEAGGESWLIPLDGVAGCRWVSAEELASPEGIVHEGAVIGHTRLSALLGRAERRTGRSGKAERGGSFVVLRTRERTLGVRVDRLLGVTQVVLRSLPAQAGRLPLVAGAAISAEGTPTLVLDPTAMIDHAVAGGAPLAHAPLEAPRLPLLVVDDSLTTRMLEHGVLTAAGWQVDLASSAEEALELVRTRRYGACLVDVEMPGMDGFELVATLRADATLRSLPCVLVTSRGSPADKQRGLGVGADAYVVKSEFQERTLLDLVDRLAGAR